MPPIIILTPIPAGNPGRTGEVAHEGGARVDDERKQLTYEDAVAMLPDGDRIHTFRNPVAGMLMGADWEREKLIAHMKERGPVELAGEQAANMKHGMVLRDHHGWLFIATKEA